MKNSINCVFPKLLRFNKYHFKKYTENKIFQIDNIVFTYDIIKHSNCKARIDFHNDVHNIYENEHYTNFHVIEFPFINGTVMSTRKVFVYKIENDKLIIKNLAGTSIEILQSDIKTIIIKNCSFKKLKILAKYCVIEIIDCNIETLQTCGYYVTTKIAIINNNTSSIIILLYNTSIFDEVLAFARSGSMNFGLTVAGSSLCSSILMLGLFVGVGIGLFTPTFVVNLTASF